MGQHVDTVAIYRRHRYYRAFPGPTATRCCSCLCTASTSSTPSVDKLNAGLLLQLAVTAMGLFTLLAVVTIAVVICRRSSTTVGVYVWGLFNHTKFISLPSPGGIAISRVCWFVRWFVGVFVNMACGAEYVENGWR